MSSLAQVGCDRKERKSSDCQPTGSEQKNKENFWL
jgi:hypothetical protein